MNTTARNASAGGWLGLPPWTLIAPLFAAAVLFGAGMGLGGMFTAVIAAALAGSVFAAVHHAEVVAHRIGEPFGTLVLALAVTLIEVALIVSLMIAGGEHAAALARDTVFASVMIILNGIIGLCLLVGGVLHREQIFDLDGVRRGAGGARGHRHHDPGVSQLHADHSGSVLRAPASSCWSPSSRW